MKRCSKCGAPLEFERDGSDPCTGPLFWYRKLVFNVPLANFWINDTDKDVKEFIRLVSTPKSYLLCMGCSLKVNELLYDFFEEDKNGYSDDQCDCGQAGSSCSIS